jgi:hypothetical protein
VAPGQNRVYDSSNLAAGEGDCTGGNIPGSGGIPQACNDGSFGTAYSLSAGYHFGPLYLTAAYEHHTKVIRTSDLATYDPNDVADERAANRRSVPIPQCHQRHLRGPQAQRAGLPHLPERALAHWDVVRSEPGPQREGHRALRLGACEKVTWRPGTHNTSGGAGPDNSANMFALAWKHKVDDNFSWYLDYATTINHPDAHYDLGAGGRSVTTDCHDASNPDSSGFDPNGGAPKCWAGS